MRRLGLLLMAVAFIAVPARAAADTDLIGLVDPTTGRWELGPDESFFFGVPGDIPFLGDWDGDGVDTPGLYRPTDGFAYVINRRETGTADASWFMGIPGDVPIVGDWDGDGIDTFSVYRPAEGKVYISNINQTGPAQVDYFFGVPGDKPFAIDFDADGTSEVALHRESTGLVYMTDGPEGGEVAPTDLEFFWGIADDAVFAGDWDGSGTETPGLIRPDRARAFLRLENTEGFANRAWPINQPGWVPVVGNVAGAPFRFDVEMAGTQVARFASVCRHPTFPRCRASVCLRGMPARSAHSGQHCPLRARSGALRLHRTPPWPWSTAPRTTMSRCTAQPSRRGQSAARWPSTGPGIWPSSAHT